MSNADYQTPNTGIKQLGAALPDRGVGGAVKSGIQGAAAGQSQRRAEEATVELNKFLKGQPESQAEVAQKAMELGQKYNVPELVQKGKQQLQSMQAGQSVQQNQMKLQQAQQDQAAQTVRGGFMAKYAENMQKNPGNPMKAFSKAYDETTKLAGSMGVDNPDSVVGQAVQPMLSNMMKSQQRGADIRAVRNGQIIGTRDGEVFTQPVPGGAGGEQSPAGGPMGVPGGSGEESQSSIVPARIRNMANDRGQILPNSENLTDVSSVPYAGGDVKGYFEQQAGIRLTDTEWSQLQSLAGRENMTQVRALEKVLRDNRSEDELRQLQQNASTGGLRPQNQQSETQENREPQKRSPEDLNRRDLNKLSQSIEKKIKDQGMDPEEAVAHIDQLNLTEDQKERIKNSVDMIVEWRNRQRREQTDDQAPEPMISPTADTTSDVSTSP